MSFLEKTAFILVLGWMQIFAICGNAFTAYCSVLRLLDFKTTVVGLWAGAKRRAPLTAVAAAVGIMGIGIGGDRPADAIKAVLIACYLFLNIYWALIFRDLWRLVSADRKARFFASLRYWRRMAVRVTAVALIVTLLGVTAVAQQQPRPRSDGSELSTAGKITTIVAVAGLAWLIGRSAANKVDDANRRAEERLRQKQDREGVAPGLRDCARGLFDFTPC
jgi:hypothetical protein